MNESILVSEARNHNQALDDERKKYRKNRWRLWTNKGMLIGFFALLISIFALIMVLGLFI